MRPQDYCQDKAAPPGSNLYYAVLFHTAQQKPGLYALFALQKELTDTVIECQDSGVARMKLQWWEEEVRRLFAAEARHPVCRALQVLIPELPLGEADLIGLVRLIEGEINPPQPDSLEQQLEQFSLSRGATWRLAALACGCDDKQAIAQLMQLGGLVNCLEFLQLPWQQLRLGYCPYPQREMDKFGLDHQDLLQKDSLPALAKLQAELFAQIASLLLEAEQDLGTKQHRALLFALTMARIARASCALLQRQVSTPRTYPLSITPLRKLWIAWKTQRLASMN